jgi:hypothetical protein
LWAAFFASGEILAENQHILAVSHVFKKIQKKYPNFFLFFKLFSILILLIKNRQKNIIKKEVKKS